MRQKRVLSDHLAVSDVEERPCNHRRLILVCAESKCFFPSEPASQDEALAMAVVEPRAQCHSATGSHVFQNRVATHQDSRSHLTDLAGRVGIRARAGGDKRREPVATAKHEQEFNAAEPII